MFVVVPVLIPFAPLIWFPLVESLEKDEEEKEDEEGVKQEVDEDEVVQMDTDDDNQKTKSKITFLEAEECCLKFHEYIKSSGAPRENIDRVLKTARSLRAHNASKPRTTTRSIQSYFTNES